MAEHHICLAIEKFGNLLLREASLLCAVKELIEEIQLELRRLQCLLKNADPRQGEDENDYCVVEIREMVYDVEDVLESFAIKIASTGRTACFLSLLGRGIFIHTVELKAKRLKRKIARLTKDLQTYCYKTTSDSSSSHDKPRVPRRSYSHDVEEDLFGREEDITLVVQELVNGQSRAMSIWGMGGLGKTTIAQKAFNHKIVQTHFDARAWASISQQWKEQDILQGILIKLAPKKRDHVKKMRVEELVEMLYEVQTRKKCLVVLDDIWSLDAWNILSPAFPRKTKGSKLLITTRIKDVAFHVDPSGLIHEPRFLNEGESWKLLQRNAFPRKDGMTSTDVAMQVGPSNFPREPRTLIEEMGLEIAQVQETASSTRDVRTDSECDLNMENVGREMVTQCEGLPLAIAGLGVILSTKHSLREWEMVRQNVSSHIRRGKVCGQKNRGVTEALALSYQDLPYKFRQCFLYLGCFPKGHAIPAEKLYQIWVAEGIISSKECAEGETMMDVAERYLGELAQRSMVQVRLEEFSPTNRKFKSCQLHGLMRDFCLLKVREENFIKMIGHEGGNETMDYSSPVSASSSNRKIRRLAIHFAETAGQYRPLKRNKASHVRSVLLFRGNHCKDIVWYLLKINFHDFKVLKVLDMDGLRLPSGKIRFAKEIGNIIHLRYLNLRHSFFSKLSSSIGNLRYLQTLDLRVLVISVNVPNVLQNMESLTHLYLPYNMHRRATLQLGSLHNLETLENFDARFCNIKELSKLTKLRKLQANIWRNIDYVKEMVKCLDIKVSRLEHTSLSIFDCAFDSEENLNVMKDLLKCKRLHILHVDGKVAKLPEDLQFSLSITKLSLRSSELTEDPMATLEKLSYLTSLSLKDNSFLGDQIVCSERGFPQLKFLELGGLPNLVRWKVAKGAMPTLIALVIFSCHKLEMINEGLIFVTTLQELTIRKMPEEFNRRVQVGGEDFHKVRHIPSIRILD